MYTRTVPVLDRFLAALSGVLKKAEDHAAQAKIDPQALLMFRLYPDMFHLTQQVQVGAGFALRGIDRLRGVEPPSLPDLTPDFAALQERIAMVRAHLAKVTPAELQGAETRSITFPMRAGPVTMSGDDYLDQFMMPQFHFHLTCVYAILRHNGVPLGKLDYMGAKA